MNSPNATKPVQTQNGPTSKKYNSAPTMNALNKTGYNAAKAKRLKLKKQIHRQARNVASVPIKMSIHINENRLEIKHPKVSP